LLNLQPRLESTRRSDTAKAFVQVKRLILAERCDVIDDCATDKYRRLITLLTALILSSKE
jgi:hypothetical protein